MSKSLFIESEFCDEVARCQVAREYWNLDKRVEAAVGYGLWDGGIENDGVSVEAVGLENLDDPSKSGPTWEVTVWIVYGDHSALKRKEIPEDWERKVLAYFDKDEPEKRIEEIKVRDGVEIRTVGVVFTLPVYRTWELGKIVPANDPFLSQLSDEGLIRLKIDLEGKIRKSGGVFTREEDVRKDVELTTYHVREMERVAMEIQRRGMKLD